LQQMQSKIREEIKASMDLDDDVGELPVSLQNVVGPIRAKLAEVDQSVEGYLVKNLNKLGDDQLELVFEILSKKSGLLQSGRVMQLANGMISELHTLDTCVEHLKRLKFELIAKFSDTLTEEFNKESGGTLAIASDRLLAEVDAIMKYRKILRKVVAETPGAAPTEVVDVAPSSCVVS
jgi:hypothetical protein